jgi:hypothetical protein
MSIVDARRAARRVRVERGIYQQPNGAYAVCFMVDGKPRFRTVGSDLAAARAERQALVEAAKRGEVPVAPNLRFGTVADRWIVRYEILVATPQLHRRPTTNQPRSQPPRDLQLIWPSFCQVRSTEGPQTRAFFLVERGGGPGVVRDARSG